MNLAFLLLFVFYQGMLSGLLIATLIVIYFLKVERKSNKIVDKKVNLE